MKKESILISSFDFPSNPYYNPTAGVHKNIVNPNDANEEIDANKEKASENIKESIHKDDEFFNQSNEEDSKII